MLRNIQSVKRPLMSHLPHSSLQGGEYGDRSDDGCVTLIPHIQEIGKSPACLAHGGEMLRYHDKPAPEEQTEAMEPFPTIRARRAPTKGSAMLMSPRLLSMKLKEVARQATNAKQPGDCPMKPLCTGYLLNA